VDMKSTVLKACWRSVYSAGIRSTEHPVERKFTWTDRIWFWFILGLQKNLLLVNILINSTPESGIVPSIGTLTAVPIRHYTNSRPRPYTNQCDSSS